MSTLISIQGAVTNASNNATIPGVKVIARQEGTEIQQETDNGGNYTLYLVPGLWRITVWAGGFNEPDAYMYNFNTDTTGIDFKLQEGYSISGQVISEENGKIAPGVIVEAEAIIDGKPVTRQELTDRNGKYRFSGLPSGRWVVQGARGETQTGKEPLTLGPDAYNINLTLSRQMTPLDRQWGRIFLGALGILLLILAGVYLWAHSRYGTGPSPELAALSNQVEQGINIAADLTKAKEVPAQDLQTLRSTIAALKENWVSVSSTLLSITEGQKIQVNLLLARAEAAAAANNPQEVEIALNTLKSVFDTQPPTYFWAQPPANYLEVVFWSLAGIFVSLLITTGYYLRRKRFYTEGIWMHLSHLLSVPLLALVVVFLLSQIKLTMQVDQSEIALDIRDPRLLAALSFIIAVRPWAMLDFVREAANRFLSQMQRRISSGNETRTQVENP